MRSLHNPHIPEHYPFRVQTQFHPYHPLHILSKSSCPYPHISPLPPPHFYKPTPNHLHSYVPTCPNHLNLPCRTTSATLRTPKTIQIQLRFLSFSNTLHIHLTIIRSVPLQTLQICFLHCPDFNPIFQYTQHNPLILLLNINKDIRN